MKHTMKKTLALMMALMLALSTFVLADDAAVVLDANGQAMANELALDGDLVLDGDLMLDGDLSLDGLSLELTQPEVPEGDQALELQGPDGEEVPVEGIDGGAEEPAGQPGASEEGASGESPVELEEAAQGSEEEIPEAQPLMPPDWAAGQELEGETDAETALAANALDENSTWADLQFKINSEATVELYKSYIAAESDERLLKTSASTTLNLNGHTIDRNLKSEQIDGGVIAVRGGEDSQLTIKDSGGNGTITGGNTNGTGGGVRMDNVNNLGPGYLTLKSGNITGNHADSNGGGVAIFEGSVFTMNGGSITNNTTNCQGGGVYICGHERSKFSMGKGTITGNHANGNGGGVCVEDGTDFTINSGMITGNTAGSDGGGVYVSNTAQFLIKNGTGIVKITGNTKGGKPNNVYLYKDAKIQIQSLSKYSQIGVSMDTPTDDNGVPIPFTNGLGALSNDKLINVFQSDDDDYAVDWVTTGAGSDAKQEAALYPRIKCTANDQSIEYDGKAHGIEVKNIVGPKGKTVPNSEIKYGTSAGGCTEDESPTVKYVSEKTVYFKITATNYYPAAGSAKVKITPRTVALDWDGKDVYTYNGQAQGPGAKINSASIVGYDKVGVTVKYKAKGAADSTLTDKKPVDAGEYVAVAVELTGADSNNYKLPEKTTKEFTIKKAPMTVTAEGYKGKYDGNAHGITVTVTTPKNAAVKYGTAADACDKDSLIYADAGTYTVCYRVTAANYVTATGSATVEITPKGLDNDKDGDGSEDSDSNVLISLNPTEYTYDGTAKEPAVTVTDRDTKQVVPQSEYTVAYSDNINAGTAKVKISDAAGGNYEVRGVKTFVINPAKMTVKAEGYKGKYDGKAHGITVTVTAPKSGYTVKYGTAEGKYDKDSLTYTDVGTYTVCYQVTAANYVTATGSATVEITPKDSDDPDSLTIELNPQKFTYDGKAKKPTVTVKDGDVVVPETEYQVTYSDNVHAGTAKVTISDVSGGKYTVKGEKTFTIQPRTVGLKWSNTSFVYNGQKHKPVATATNLVSKDKCQVSVDGAARNAGTHTARAIRLSNPDYALPKKVTKTFTIIERGTDDPNTKFVAQRNGGAIVYDGTAKKPVFVVKCIVSELNGVASNTVMTVPASEYKVSYYDNVDAGTATVKITDVPGGNFNVVCDASFTIARRKATVTAIDQRVKTVDAVNRGVEAVKTEGLAKRQTLKSVKLDVSVKAGAKKGEIVPEKAKIADAKGNDVTRNYKLSYVAGSLTLTQEPKPEPEPEPDYTLLAVMKTCGNHALKMSWTRVPGADGYEVTFVKEDRSFRKAEVVYIRSRNICKFTGLKKNTAYKAYVRAWKYEGNALTYIGRKSPVVCAITGDVRKHKTNAARVCVNASRVKLNVGERTKISATVKGVKRGKNVMRWEHALLRWYSSNANVAVVNAKGEIRAVGAGECTVYALAANGVAGAVKVTVK